MNVTEAVVDRVVAHVRTYLLSLPEWPLVLASDRDTRKRVARVIAREVTRIPHIEAFPESARAAAAQEAAKDAVLAMGLEVPKEGTDQ